MGEAGSSLVMVAAVGELRPDRSDQRSWPRPRRRQSPGQTWGRSE